MLIYSNLYGILMNFVFATFIGSILIGATALNVWPQQTDAQLDLCGQINEAPCIYFPIKLIMQWWPWGLIDWTNISTLPDNLSINISVKHGDISDTVTIEIPKALSGVEKAANNTNIPVT